MNPKTNSNLSHEDVEVFLLDHPDFFMSRDSLLAELNLPHQSGAAVSLVERQVAVLRERSRDLRQRLNHLLDAAHDNDQLFYKTQKMVLALLETQNLDDVVTTVQSALRDEYQVDTHSLVLFGDKNDFTDVNALVVDYADAEKTIGTLINNNKATCGVLRETEMDFLFPSASKKVASAAVIPLHNENTFGLLAIGSFDAEKYRSNIGVLFLSYIAEILNGIVPPFLPTSSG